ncbi:MAG: tetratricopeptide repeat protein [Rhodothermales bacterium]
MKFGADVRRLKWVLALYVAVSLLLWPWPVFGLLHAESSAVVAAVAFFGAGPSALQLFQQNARFRWVLGRHEAALAVPWALLTLSLLWRPNCGYLQGLLFFALFPAISVMLAVALAFALSAAPWRRKKMLFCGIGGAIMLFAPLYDLGLHPQFYVYNHVFGGVLGPIYDEELALRPGLFWFRGLTLLWAGLAYFVGREGGRGKRGRGGEEENRRKEEKEGRGNEEPAPFPSHPQPPTPPHGLSPFLPFLIAILIATVYLFAAPLGINTTAGQIERTLGGHRQTPHFDIYYDPDVLTPGAVDRLAQDHEYRYAWLAERLGTDVQRRIQSYLYPDAETKAHLTGARYTNVAPVWLRTPQTHVLWPTYSDVFGHELAHVFSREFGLPVLKASLSVGLVEGLAVALEPPDGRPSPPEQVAVALLGQIGLETEKGDLAAALAARLSPFGFWTSRGAVSYTTMGSFVGYLLEAYGPDPLKAVYACGQFEDVYGKPLVDLAREWEGELLGQPVTARSAEALVARRFTIPSLFEQPCPHHVPAYQRRYRDGQAALEAGDTMRAVERFEASLDRQPTYGAALDAWAQVHLAQADPAAVIARLDTLSDALRSPALALRLGDAYALLDDAETARHRYDEVLRKLPRYARTERSLLVLRKSLAEAPAVVRVLTSLRPAAEQAERLDGFTGPDVRVMRALLLGAADAYEPAAALLRATPAPEATTLEEREDLYRQRLAWLAALEYGGGNAPAAAAYANEAAEAALRVGDLNEVARLADVGHKMRWIQQHTP